MENPSQEELKEQNSNNSKSKYLIAIIILLTILLCIFGSIVIYLLLNNTEDEKNEINNEENIEEKMFENEMDREEFKEEGSQEEPEDKPEDTNQATPPGSTKECLYNDGSQKIRFEIPKTWTCTVNPGSASSIYNVLIESSSIKLYVGMLIVAPCQNPNGCKENTIYSSDKVRFMKVEDNYGGTTSYNTYGEFIINGKTSHSVYLDLLEPLPNVRDLSKVEIDELSKIFDSVTYPN